MLNWLIPVLNFLGGPAINGLVDAYKEKLKLQGSSDKLAVDLAVQDLQAQIEARKQAYVLSSSPFGATVQIAFGLPLAFYFGKILVWDLALGWGSTEPIRDAYIGSWATTVVSFYFGGMIVSNVVGKVAAILGKR